jgi:hypothetical protein
MKGECHLGDQNLDSGTELKWFYVKSLCICEL